MDNKYFIAILFSAFFHAFYNLLIRKNHGSITYLFFIFLIASIVSFITFSVNSGIQSFSFQGIYIIFISSVFYVFYQIFVARAYSYGNISSTYPLTVLSPIFIPIWAGIFLHEQLNAQIIMGIVLAICGAVLVKMKNISVSELKIVLNFTNNKGATYALLASFMYSIGALFDKMKISQYSLDQYVFMILFFMFFNMTIISFKSIDFKKAPTFFTKNIFMILLGGILVFLSFAFFRYVLKNVMVSIAVPVRQISIVFAILLGVYFLKEKVSMAKIVGSLIIILGIVLINWK